MKYEYEGPDVKSRASLARASGCYILKFRGNYEREDFRQERLSFILYALTRFNDARFNLITDLNHVSSNHGKKATVRIKILLKNHRKNII